MQIWPAIDLRGGMCVRLEQGDYGRETIFGADPAAMARHWVDQGAHCLHLVDLDGARSGRVENAASLRAILSAVDVPCELGGGIRDEASIRELLELGLTRLVIGTQALKRPEWFREVCRRYPQRLVLGIDARNGRVATEGWLEESDMAATTLARQFAGEPIAALIYTDIATDGMLCGPNLTAIGEMQQAVDLPLVASGGIARLDDVVSLCQLDVAGCIVGRSLYEGTLDLASAIAATQTQ